jgi:hypothetical protein
MSAGGQQDCTGASCGDGEIFVAGGQRQTTAIEAHRLKPVQRTGWAS